MRNVYVGTSAPKRKVQVFSRAGKTELTGSLADLVARAEGRAIYCTAGPSVNRALIGLVIETFGREFRKAIFVNARAHYRHDDDRRHRWRVERELYGAAIVVTRAANLPENVEPFDGIAGEHAIGSWIFTEIASLVRLERPTGWYAMVSPAAYWQARFTVEPFAEMEAAHFARLLPTNDAAIFRPVIKTWLRADDAEGPR